MDQTIIGSNRRIDPTSRKLSQHQKKGGDDDQQRPRREVARGRTHDRHHPDEPEGDQPVALRTHVFTKAARRNERDSKRDQHQNRLGVGELQADDPRKKARRRNNLCTDPKPSRGIGTKITDAMAGSVCPDGEDDDHQAPAKEQRLVHVESLLGGFAHEAVVDHIRERSTRHKGAPLRVGAQPAVHAQWSRRDPGVASPRGGHQATPPS